MNVARFTQRLRVGLALAVLLPANFTAAAPARWGSGNTPVQYGSGHWQACDVEISEQGTSSGTFVALGTCSLAVGGPGHIIVLASASMGIGSENPGSYQAAFRLDHNTGLTGDPATERHVDAYPDDTLIPDGNGTDRAVSISAYYTVTAGVQTFTLLYRRISGSAIVNITSGRLDALFIPDGTDLQTCGVNSTAVWTSASGSYADTVTCSLTFAKPGRVFASADGWLGLITGGSPPYEAVHRISQDGGPGLLRYTNIYTNTGDGVDLPVGAANVFTATAGTHTYSLMQARYSTTGMVRLLNAGLVVLYVPFDSAYAVTCGGVAPTSYFTTSNSYTTAASCALSVPSDSWVFAAGNLGYYYSTGAYEARFALAHDDSSQPDDGTNRWVTSYDDSDDGLDASLTSNEIFTATAGLHTIYFIGRRVDGTGTVAARSPVVFALAPAASVYVPVSLGD